jgi:hopene-associated glycosyltransferase HpnB
MTAVTLAALLALGIWLWLLVGRDGFWLARDTDEADPPALVRWPPVVAVVPARDEAEVIGTALGSILAQDYCGALRVVLVDDGSSDGTGDIARALDDARLAVVPGSTPPPGWTGKLWALATGVAHRTTVEAAPRYLWFSDADIAHAPDTLSRLVARSEAEGLALHSLMARLETRSWAERALIPAFVFFFQMLYPFARVNRPGPMAAAAGGCMVVRRAALEQAGGVKAIAHQIIDDCAMGRALKRQGPIRLTLTRRSASIRPYGGFGSIYRMIARSAYAQLRYSPLLLLGTVLGMAVMYAAPVIATIAVASPGGGLTAMTGLLGWGAMAVAFQPMLRFYGRSPLWGIALPAIAGFYAAATVGSAVAHMRGRGGQWKGRAQAGLEGVIS